MSKFTNFALAALATMTLVGVSAQDRHGDPDELDARQLLLNDGKKSSIWRKSTIDDLR